MYGWVAKKKTWTRRPREREHSFPTQRILVGSTTRQRNYDTLGALLQTGPAQDIYLDSSPQGDLRSGFLLSPAQVLIFSGFGT